MVKSKKDTKKRKTKSQNKLKILRKDNYSGSGIEKIPSDEVTTTSTKTSNSFYDPDLEIPEFLKRYD